MPFASQKAIASSPLLPFVTNSRQISTLPALQPPVYGIAVRILDQIDVSI
jgi:hypothetical protein